MRVERQRVFNSEMQKNTMRRTTKLLVAGAALAAGITTAVVINTRPREPQGEDITRITEKPRSAVVPEKVTQIEEPGVLEEKKEGDKIIRRYSDRRTTIEDERTTTTIFPDGEESTLFKVRQRGKGGEAIPAIEIE